MDPSATMIEFEDVHLGYEGVKVLDGLSFSLPRGEGLVLVALTGGGKTTVLRAAGGLIPPDRGTLRVDGRNLAEFSYDEHQAFLRDAGYVFQNAALLINMRVFDNVALPLRYHRPELGEAEIARRVEEVLRRFGVLAKAAEFPATLSTGERRQVNFARSLVLEPKLLFLDDPFTGVSPAVARKVSGILLELKRERGVTLLVCAESVSHLVDNGLVERIGVLKRGRLARMGGVQDYLKKNTLELRRSIQSIQGTPTNRIAAAETVRPAEVQAEAEADGLPAADLEEGAGS